MVTSKIQPRGGVPTLFVNGKPIVPMAYITYRQEENCYEDFAKSGYGLFSVQMPFAERTVNEQYGMPPFQGGIYEEKEPNYALIDKNIRRILEVCPNAYILPRVNVNLSEKWEREHPDELCFEKYRESYCACFASDEWAAEIKRLLRDFVSYIERSDYCDRIIGYQIAAGNTEEWIPLAPNGGDGKRMREAFERYSLENGIVLSEKELDFFKTPKTAEEFFRQAPATYRRFISQVTAERIVEFAAETKKLTGGRLVVGGFYGYTMECCDWRIGHHCLERVLECGDIDFLCSPISYLDLRKAGTDAYNMLPVDSLKLHNVLYFAENDTRTHLTRPACDLPRYNDPIFLGPDKATSAENIKMHFSRALTHGHAMWWFDMWGGWFHDDCYMAILKRCAEIFEDCSNNSRISSAQTAVFIDECAWAECDDSDWVVSAKTRRTLGLAGAPYDIFLMSDFERVYRNYKAIVFAVPAKTPHFLQAERLAKENSVPYLIIENDGSELSENDVAKFYEQAGVFVYSSLPAVVYASQSHVFLHTAKAGEYDFSLPNGKREFTDLFDGKKYCFPCKLEFGKSLLFKAD